MPGFGFALAATTLVGQGLGQGVLIWRSKAARSEPVRRHQWLCWVWLVFAPVQVVRLFTQDPQVIELASYVCALLLSQPAGLCHGDGGALRQATPDG